MEGPRKVYTVDEMCRVLAVSALCANMSGTRCLSSIRVAGGGEAPIMHADTQYDSRGLTGTQRATAMSADESPQGVASPRPAVIPPDPEVVATPTRRRFTAEDKLRILTLADACTAVGSLGALLRAECLYASHLTTWRRQCLTSIRIDGWRQLELWVGSVLRVREPSGLRRFRLDSRSFPWPSSGQALTGSDAAWVLALAA